MVVSLRFKSHLFCEFGLGETFPAIKQGCKVAFVLAGLLAVMIGLAALDVWIWVPHFKY